MNKNQTNKAKPKAPATSNQRKGFKITGIEAGIKFFYNDNLQHERENDGIGWVQAESSKQFIKKVRDLELRTIKESATGGKSTPPAITEIHAIITIHGADDALNTHRFTACIVARSHNQFIKEVRDFESRTSNQGWANKPKAPATGNQRKGFKVGEIFARITDDNRLLLAFRFNTDQEEVCDITDEVMAYSRDQIIGVLRELEREANNAAK